ncbi:amidohydrolase [Phyllosticta citribraziliensis]
MDRENRGARSPRPHFRKSRSLKLVAVACLVFLAYAQWCQLNGNRPANQNLHSSLSASRLQSDFAKCPDLRRKPNDPSGVRHRNARAADESKPTLIRNATVWTGEPVSGTTAQEAFEGIGYTWTQADVFVENGLIKKVGAAISESELPSDYQVYDAQGFQLTSGIVDMHSHAGVDPLPQLDGNEDTNELSADITPFVRSIDGLDPLDHQIQVIKSGGVTTSLILPGSGNNIGGEAFVIKHAVGKPDGRSEISAKDMLADPEGTWRYMKMACGENAKRVYGKVGERGPYSRLGESWEFRHAFEQASALVKAQDEWCDAASARGPELMESYLPQELRWEALAAVLRGQVLVNTHCYTIPDLEAFVDHTNEFKFPIRAFHHAHETYIVPEILKRAWGGRPPAAALFADNMLYKAEAYRGSEQAGKILYENGITPVYVSDNPVLNAQHVVFEAAKAYRYGLPYHAALAGVTSAPAELLGLGERIGKIKPGFDADIVLWDSDPLSVGAAPVQVWIDGTAQYEDPYVLKKPKTGPINPQAAPPSPKDQSFETSSVVFTGISKILTTDLGDALQVTGESPQNVVVVNGTITCVGPCHAELSSASAADVIHVENGHLSPPFTLLGSTLGLSEIDAEDDTNDGSNGKGVFSRAVDGLLFDNKQLAAAYRHGVTKAVTAPVFSGGGSYGVSAGFLAHASHALEDGAVWADEVAVHYTLGLGAKDDTTPSISSAVGALRDSLLGAIDFNETLSTKFSAQSYFHRVVTAQLPLVISVDSADTTAAILRVKAAVEQAANSKIRVAIVGGAESHLVAKELAAADVGVVLAPLLQYSQAWDQRRSLTGAPLTNGTAVNALVDAGVLTAIGTAEDWEARDLGLMAGVAYANGEGKLSEQDALALVSANVYKILGLDQAAAGAGGPRGDFVVYEGSPLETRSRVVAVGSGQGVVSVFE